MLKHLWTRPVNSDHPVVVTYKNWVAVSADFTAYLIRHDGKLLAKKYYKGTRLGKPCISDGVTAFPGDGAVFLYENKRGKPSGIIPTGTKGIACAFKNDLLGILTPRSFMIYKKIDNKYEKVDKVKVKGEGLDVSWLRSLILGTTEGIQIERRLMRVGRSDIVREGPLIAASVPEGLLVTDGEREIMKKEGLEVTGIAWLGDLLAVSDRGGRRVIVLDVGKDEVIREFKFTGVVRSFDWHTLMVIAQRRKVQAYFLLPDEAGLSERSL